MRRSTLLLALLSGALATTVIVLLAERRPPVEAPSASGVHRILYYRDPMNPANTSPTPRKAPDGMDYVPVYADDGAEPRGGTEGVRIDPGALQTMGARIEPVVRRDLSKTIRTVGRVDYDETRLYDVTTKVSGYIDKLYVDFTGQRVRRDQPLLEIYSPDVVSTEKEYLDALQSVAAAASRNSPEELEAAKKIAASARWRLQLWDIPEHQIREIETRKVPQRTVMLHSPVDGVVLDKMVLQGAAIQPGMNLFRIADLSRVWVYADVFEYELPWVAIGDEARIELSYLPGRSFTGRVVYIAPSLTPETRTARVRIELPNPAGAFELRPNMFATVRLVSKPLEGVLVVPDQAVIRSGERTLVVLALGGGRFTSREVRLGVVSDSLDQVLDGLAEGDRIVTSGQFLIDSESNLRAAVNALAPPDSSRQAPEDTAASAAGGMPGMTMTPAGRESAHPGARR